MTWRILCVAALLAACQPAAQTPTEQSERVGQPTPPTSTVQVEVTLEPIILEDIAGADLAGLGCGFTAPQGMLFVARAPDDPAIPSPGLIKIDGAIVRLASADPGTIEATFDGGAWSGDGLEVTVTPTGEGRPEGPETTFWTATLTAVRDGARAEYAGEWNCGA